MTISVPNNDLGFQESVNLYIANMFQKTRTLPIYFTNTTMSKF